MYLISHDSLFKPRPHHRLLPGLLTPAPDARSIRCLHGPHLLRLLDCLYKRGIVRAHWAGWHSIGRGDILLLHGRLWVVRRWVVDSSAV